MTIPEFVNARWLATLSDAELVGAETTLRAEFAKHEAREKRRAGSHYIMMQGPTVLVNAWLRFTQVSNERRTRGLVANYHRASSTDAAADA